MNHFYTEIRRKAFMIKPEDVGVLLKNNEQVYTSIVDMNVNGNLVTLLCTFDGSVSLYYSNGKCDVGLGENEKIKHASISFLMSAGQCIKNMQKVTHYPIEMKSMQIYLFARDGIYQKNIIDNEMKTKETQFLEFLVNNVLTAIRNYK